MIHDIDIILSVVPSAVKEIHASGIAVISQSPDIANARILFENGCVANLTASRISMKNMRKSRFFQKDAYISVDFLEKTSEIVRMKDAPKNIGPFDMVLQNAEGDQKQIYFEKPTVAPNNAILEELDSFALAISNQTTPVVSLQQGGKALEIAQRIIKLLLMDTIKNIAVIGAGTMGNGIAHVFAQHGFKVSLIDREISILKKALETIEKNLNRQADKGQINSTEIPEILSSISLHSKLEEGLAHADLVIEAIVEDLEVKKILFKNLSNITAANTILASNTSSISITQLAQATSKPEKVIGMHFMNPVPLMTLVEVISGQNSSQTTIDAVESLTQKIGKKAVHAKDYPGFIANRILMPMINEAIETLFQGIGSIEGIDAI
ncbi:3-hydroxybutyryl-CoA dehydrogenase, partial [Flavobacteria bacterium MS024-3C]